MVTDTDTKLLNFKNSYDWRHWLSRNYDVEKEARLIIDKNSDGKNGICYREALEEALGFGWVNDEIQSVDEDKCIFKFSRCRLLRLLGDV